MNISELARILKISPQELRDKLPQMGFHIGHKAIKIDNRTAQKIIKNWPKLFREIERLNALDEAKNKKLESEKVIEIKPIKIPNYITVRDFAELAQIPVSKILAELMKNGVFASMNERIDFDTACIIGDNLHLEVSLDEDKTDEKETSKNKLKEILDREENLEIRSPIIVVMGHVDHGKTKLLDAIRRTNVISTEAGGITQHIGAYQVVRRNRLITFIDTPGHEAFTAMRSRGAKVADIAILVVAADDGVKPQTTEAFKIIEAAKIPYIVAINKIDKPDANVNQTKQELSSKLNILPEDWGGKVSCALVSALKGDGIDDLLDTILLLSDVESDNIMANPHAPAAGAIIESHIDKGAGPVATILIQNGTLRVGDQLCFDGKIYGKIKALKDYKGDLIKDAGPSVPVEILGLKIMPEVGDLLEVGEGIRIKASQMKNKQANKQGTNQTDDDTKDGIKTLNLIIKSDVLGSAEAIEESLEKLNNEEVKIKIIHKGLGNITEGDVRKAETTGSQLLAFHVKLTPQVENLVRTTEVVVKTFDIIYDLIKYAKEEVKKLTPQKFVRRDIGRLKVLAIFKTEDGKMIVGGKVLDGQAELDSTIEIFRNKEMIGTGKLTKLQSGKQDVKIVDTDEECGILYEGSEKIEDGDILNFFKTEEEKK